MILKNIFNLGGNDENKEERNAVSNNPTISANIEKKQIEKPIVIIPTYDAKLTILLIENSTEMAKNKAKLTQIVKSLVACDNSLALTGGYVSTINYGTSVRETKPTKREFFNFEELLYNEDLSDNTCFHEAIFALEDVVNNYNEKLIEEKLKKFFIKDIEVIGIGSCVDNYTKISKNTAISSFNRVASLRNVTTKYFCFSDSTFVEAATIGFHSIGAINRNYK